MGHSNGARVTVDNTLVVKLRRTANTTISFEPGQSCKACATSKMCESKAHSHIDTAQEGLLGHRLHYPTAYPLHIKAASACTLWKTRANRLIMDFTRIAGSKLSHMGVNTPEGRQGSRALQRCEQRLAVRSRQRAQ